MCLFIASLNSGSNGNCYYVGNNDDAVLVDAGISCREIEKRMGRLQLPLSRLRAIFISHEHTDHISGVATLSKKYQLPVYITGPTFNNSGLTLEPSLVRNFRAYQPVAIGSLNISAFPKFHDACDPHSFVVYSASVMVGVFTDIGYACKEVITHFKKCSAVFLESNYDEVMLMQGKYPYFLKNRIRSGQGHLSNAQALQVFMDHRPAAISHLLLSHLSKENNCPDLVTELFRPHALQTQIIVTSRYEETPVYNVHAGKIIIPALHKHVHYRPAQLSLF